LMSFDKLPRMLCAFKKALQNRLITSAVSVFFMM
jgi:hypothetical protein